MLFSISFKKYSKDIINILGLYYAECVVSQYEMFLHMIPFFLQTSDILQE